LPTLRSLQTSTIAADVLGTPITTGFPLGSIKFNGATGSAVLSFSATGPKGAGRVFLEAIKTHPGYACSFASPREILRPS
jgi:Cytochrome oxidase complex assembly protein 1